MNIQDNRKRCYESSGSNDNNHTKERNPPGVNREFKTKRKDKNEDDFENRIPIRFGEIRADVVVRLSYTLAIDVRLQRLCNIKHEKRKKEKIHQLQMSYDNKEGINKKKQTIKIRHATLKIATNTPNPSSYSQGDGSW
jgi:hypothetical protein